MLNGTECRISRLEQQSMPYQHFSAEDVVRARGKIWDVNGVGLEAQRPFLEYVSVLLCLKAPEVLRPFWEVRLVGWELARRP